jgi:hypothetical protein
MLSGQILGPFPVLNQSEQNVARSANISGGAIASQVQAASFRASGQIAGSWNSSAVSGFQAGTLNAASATVQNSTGQTVGTGAVGLSVTSPVPAAISGATTYAVTGTGDLSFYGPATSALGVSGNWTGYTATLTGSPAVTLTTGGLTLNGSALPSGTYTVTASSITVGGLGQTTTPSFASSATLNLTASTLNLGPGTGSFTSAGAAVDPTNGIALDSYSGTATVAGNGSVDTVTLAGSATRVLAVAGAPATLTANQNKSVTFATSVTTSLADTYAITAEAPAGWTVSTDTSGNVTVTAANGLQSGTVPVFLTAISSTDPALAIQASVSITLQGTQPGVTLSVAPDQTFSVPLGNALLPSAYRATIQNTGPAADTFSLTFPTAPAGFTVLDSQTSITIPAGGVAVAGIYLTPSGALPAPGTVVPFSVAVTSTTNSAITASSSLSLTVPAVQAINVTANPTSLSTVPGSPAATTLTLQSVGNVAVTAAVSSTVSTGLSLGGLNTPVTLNPGQTVTQPLTLTASASAALGQPLLTTINATYGSGNSLTAGANIVTQVNAAQAAAAASGSTAAQSLGRNDIAATLSGLSTAINTLAGSCGDSAKASVLAYVNNLIQEMNAPFLQSFANQLQSAASAISSATCSNIGAALTQLSGVLSGLSTALSSPAAFPFNLQLLPNTAIALPNQPVQFQISLQNNSTTNNTYTLSLGSLPSGVSGNLSTTSVTLVPGQSTTTPTVTITPTGAQAFQFGVTASVNGVSASAQTATGVFTARSQFIQVQDVTATPGFTTSGGSVDVVAHIANQVNQSQTVKVALAIQNSSNTTVGTAPTQTVSLSVTNLITTVDFGQVSRGARQRQLHAAGDGHRHQQQRHSGRDGDGHAAGGPAGGGHSDREPDDARSGQWHGHHHAECFEQQRLVRRHAVADWIARGERRRPESGPQRQHRLSLRPQLDRHHRCDKPGVAGPAFEFRPGGPGRDRLPVPHVSG